MTMHSIEITDHGSRMRIPRSRGATSGILLILLGAWTVLVPVFGHLFNFAYNASDGFGWTAEQGWLQVLPGAVAIVGGALLVTSRNRAAAMLGGWLAIAAGAWLVVGNVVARVLPIDEMGGPVADSNVKWVAVQLAYFSGIGTLIVLLAALAVGRLSVRSLRDIEYAESEATTREAQSSGDLDERSGSSGVDHREGRSRGWRQLFHHDDTAQR